MASASILAMNRAIVMREYEQDREYWELCNQFRSDRHWWTVELLVQITSARDEYWSYCCYSMADAQAAREATLAAIELATSLYKRRRRAGESVRDTLKACRDYWCGLVENEREVVRR